MSKSAPPSVVSRVGNECVEMYLSASSEVRLDEYMVVTMGKQTMSFDLDAIFVEACEPGSIRLVGAVPTRAAAVGGLVSKGKVVVQITVYPSTVTLHLSGIRRGQTQRFARRNSC